MDRTASFRICGQLADLIMQQRKILALNGIETNERTVGRAGFQKFDLHDHVSLLRKGARLGRSRKAMVTPATTTRPTPASVE